jgi:selenocysteine-specific elongation factor
MKPIIVGTAGHIDHGKSALVRALTGIDPDRLEEEKRRGITIDLGFAHLDLGEGLRLGFIDVPGHERFVKNMLAGVGGIDLLLLVVAADESIMPQTREHFDISRLLGIRKGLVAITKSDLVSQDLLELVKIEVQEFVAGSFLENAPLVPVSARTGEGIEELKSELRRLSAEVVPKPVESPFRLPIDRAFVMKGFGAVVTGTLVSGKVRREAEVEVFPVKRRVRVRGIQVHNEQVEEALAGQRTALNLAGIEARELARGMTLATPDLFRPTNCLDGILTLLPSARPLKNRTRVHFHCWTLETVADVLVLEGKEIKPGTRCYVQLRLAEPGLFLPGDRFILRQFSPVVTVGGGEILDNLPARHRLSDPDVIPFLRALAAGNPDQRAELFARQAGELPLPSLVERTGWQPSEALRVARTLEERNRVVMVGTPPALIIHSDFFRSVSRKVIEQLERFHAAHPLVIGIAKEELRARCAPVAGGKTTLPSAAVFNAVLQDLCARGKVIMADETVRISGREIQLSAEELAAKNQIEQAFEKAGLAVPSAKDVLASARIDSGRAQKLLQLLLKEKTLVKVSEDLVFHRSAMSRLREILARQKSQGNRISVPIFKEITGLSRKYAIPLLEHFDREGVTRREGDVRVIL